MQIDIFCDVIDNLGDAGVCLRLARDLAKRGHYINIYINDITPLNKIAPQETKNIKVKEYNAPCEKIPNILIESFGCNIPQEYLSKAFIQNEKKPIWINLEYLSAEDYVEKSHKLPSPIMSGVAKGATKYFFYPGFTQKTGGLIKNSTNIFNKTKWLNSREIDKNINFTKDDDLQDKNAKKLISVFCYKDYNLDKIIPALNKSYNKPIFLITKGLAYKAMQPYLGQINYIKLPYISQIEFDEMINISDFNIIRGEDSLSRAVLSGKPWLWQAYIQEEDNAHHNKISALMNKTNAPDFVRGWHKLINKIDDYQIKPLDEKQVKKWQDTNLAFKKQILDIDDLGTQLLTFCTDCALESRVF